MTIRLSTILKGFLALLVAVVVTAIAILYSTDFSAYKNDIEALVRDATGRDLVIEGEFKPTLGLTPSVVVDQVRFSNAPWGSRKEMARIGELRAELELLPAFFGEIRIKQVVLSGADILLETKADGTGNWIMEAPRVEKKTAASGRAPTIPTFDRIVIEDSRITWRDGGTGATSLVRIDRLRAQARTLDGPLRFGLKGAYNDHPIGVEGTVGSLRGIAAGSSVPLDLTFAGGGAKGAVKGAIKHPVQGKGITLKLSASGKDLAALNGLVGASLPAIGPYGLSGTLSDQGRRWQLKDIELSLGGSDLSGTVTIDPRLTPVGIVANVTSNLLREVDFRDRNEPAVTKIPVAKARKASDASDDRRVFPDGPLPLHGLRGLNIKLDLKAKSIETSDRVLKNVSLDLSLKKGTLVIRPFKAEYGDGQFLGGVRLKTAGGAPQLSLDVHMATLDLAQIIKEAGYPGLLTGHIKAKASLSGTGASVRSLMAKLNGTIEVTMNGGRIDRKLLDLLGADAFEALSPWSSQDKGIEIKCLVGRYRITNGKLRSDATVFDTDRLLVVGKGGVNLATEEIDFTVMPTARDVSLLKLIVALRLGGTLASPTILPDPGAIARGAVGVATGIVSGRIIGTVIGQIISGSPDGGRDNACLAALQAKTRDALPENAAKPQPSEEKGARKIIKGIGDGIKGPIKGAGKVIEGVGKGLHEPSKGAKKVLEGVGEGLKAPVEGAGKVIKGVGEGLKELLGQ